MVLLRSSCEQTARSCRPGSRAGRAWADSRRTRIRPGAGARPSSRCAIDDGWRAGRRQRRRSRSRSQPVSPGRLRSSSTTPGRRPAASASAASSADAASLDVEALRRAADGDDPTQALVVLDEEDGSVGHGIVDPLDGDVGTGLVGASRAGTTGRQRGRAASGPTAAVPRRSAGCRRRRAASRPRRPSRSPRARAPALDRASARPRPRRPVSAVHDLDLRPGSKRNGAASGSRP